MEQVRFGWFGRIAASARTAPPTIWYIANPSMACTGRRSRVFRLTPPPAQLTISSRELELIPQPLEQRHASRCITIFTRRATARRLLADWVWATFRHTTAALPGTL